MFYLSYIRSELLRRRSRTILTLTGFAIGVALVIVISSLSRGLDHAQQQTLNPLASIGTDLTVTLKPQTDNAGFGGGGGAGGGGGGARQAIVANQSALTDLSKLGKPGAKFDHTFLLPGTQLTFPASQASQIRAIDGVEAASSGLVLSAVHQTGTVPKIVANLKTGGQRVTVTGRVRFNFSAAEREKIRACFEKAAQSSGAQTAPGGQGAAGAQGGGSLGGGNGGQGGGFRGSAAAQQCLPAQSRNFRRSVVTPDQIVKQVVDPPQTNISSSTYSIAGVDPKQPEIGLVTPGLVSTGRFLKQGNEALVADGYASQRHVKVGAKITLNSKTFTVVGIVKPPLGGQTADVYVPLDKLQSLGSQKNLANVVLVRASDSSSVGAVKKAIEQRFPNAQVADSKQVADQINGSLVDASNLSHNLGTVLAVLAALAAFAFAALLTLTSVGKRVRELGTLKALGWTQRQVVRQVVGESLAQGVLGGVIGVLLGIGAVAVIGAFAPTLAATSSPGSATSTAFGLGALGARTVTDEVTLTAPILVGVLAIGFLLALAGGLLAGLAGALRAARLRPADALRTVE